MRAFVSFRAGTATSHRWAWFCLLIFAVCHFVAISVSASEFFTDFNSGTPVVWQTSGNAVVNPVGGIDDTGFLRLTPADKNMSGTFVLDELDDQPVHGFVARFKAWVGSGWRNGADGFCFTFAKNLPNKFAEEGSGKGLVVTFDTYTKNGAGPQTVRVKYNEAVIAEEPATLRTGKRFADVEIELSPDKTLNVFYDGTHVIKDLTIANYSPTRGQFGLAARTGDLLDNHCIEDLSIVTQAGDRPPLVRKEIRKQPAMAAPVAEVFWYLNGSDTFKGALFRPPGKGPFPAVIFCQHQQSAPEEVPQLAESCVSQGYILLVPGRYLFTGPIPESAAGAEQRLSHENEFQAANLQSAIQVLKARSYIDETRVVVMGHGAGAISALLASEQDLGIRGLLLFSPDRGIWDRSPSLRTRLKRAVENSTVPIFVGHRAENDEEPFITFKEIIEKKGPPNHAEGFKVTNGKPGNGEIVVDAAELRQDRVFTFLQEVLK